jgi:hypothetical protein
MSKISKAPPVRPSVTGFLLLLSMGPQSVAGPGVPATLSDRGDPRCYDIEYGQWKIGNEKLDLYSPLPVRIALTDERVDSTDPTSELWVARWPMTETLRAGTWRQVGQDSVTIRLPSWWSTGLWLALARTTDALEGTADVYVDYVGGKPTYAHVTLRPTSCPDSIPRPWH